MNRIFGTRGRLVLAALMMAGVTAVVAIRAGAGPVGAEPTYQRVDTSAPRMSGKVVAVAPSADLQAAVNAAQPGDTLVLAAGATYHPITLPAKSVCYALFRESQTGGIAASELIG